MTTPVGDNTYKGLGAPLSGEYEQVQRNSSNSMVTLTHSSGNAGAFLTGRDFVSTALQDKGSSLQSGVVFVIDADGGYELRSGTTVLMEITSSGIEGAASTASAYRLDSSGRLVGAKLNVINVTTATTTYTAISSLSGSLIVFSSVDTSGQNLLLPSNASSLTIGVYFDVFVGTRAATAFDITSTAHTSAEILLHGGGAATVSTALAIGLQSTNAGSIRVTAISTLQWLAEPKQYLNSTWNATTADFTSVDIVGYWSTIAPIA